MEIHHIGYLTKHLDSAKIQFEKLGFSAETEKAYDSHRMLNILFMTNGSYRVELIEPSEKESPLYPLLKKYKNTPYHFCYKTESLINAIQLLEEEGYHVIQEPLTAPCIEGKTVAFLMHGDMGIIELLEN